MLTINLDIRAALLKTKEFPYLAVHEPNYIIAISPAIAVESG
jgi:hypothetical protein